MENINYIALVKAVERLRLINNTKEEWYAYLNEAGFKTNNRGFQQRDALAIFNKISKWIEDKFSISLFDLLTDYQLFSSINYTNRTKRHSAINMNSIKETYKEIIIEGYKSSLKDIDKVMSEIEQYGYNIDLLFLITLGAIPAYDTNPQEVVFSRDIKSMYFHIKNFIAELYPKFSENQQEHNNVPFNVEMEKHPYIQKQLHQIEKRIDSQEATRIDLIAFLINTTDNLYVNYHKEALYENNIAMDKIELPEIDNDCIWIEEDKDYKDCNFYWEFIQIGMDYFLYKFDRRANTYTKYTIIFFDEKAKIQFYAAHPEAIKFTCKGEPIEHQLFVFGNIELYMDKKETLQTITFHSYENKVSDKKKFIQGGFPPNALKRIPYNIDKKWFDQWEYQKDSFNNEFPQYEYDIRNKERLISSKHIYVEKEGVLIEGSNETYRITSWYEIPRLNSKLPLEQINIDSLILTYQMLERNYITFVEANVSIDVTDEESLKQYGISITSNPTILKTIDK